MYTETAAMCDVGDVKFLLLIYYIMIIVAKVISINIRLELKK